MMSTYRHLQGGKRNLTDYGLLHMAQGFYSIRCALWGKVTSHMVLTVRDQAKIQSCLLRLSVLSVMLVGSYT